MVRGTTGSSGAASSREKRLSHSVPQSTNARFTARPRLLPGGIQETKRTQCEVHVSSTTSNDPNQSTPEPTDDVRYEEYAIGWLLLRDDHAAPIYGLAPELIKRSKAEIVRVDGRPLGSAIAHNAIVGMLGFEGDFGDYKHTHWPRLQALLREHGLDEQRNVFAYDRRYAVDLWFGFNPRRRSLADRLFFGPEPRPTRAFNGYAFDFEGYCRDFQRSSRRWLPGDDDYEPRDLYDARRWVYDHRFELDGMHNFMGDQLLVVDRPPQLEWKIYCLAGSNIDADLARGNKTWSVFRWIIDQDDGGWLDIIPVNERLIVLGAADGSWDFVWRDYRDSKPPEARPAAGIRGMPLAYAPSWHLAEPVKERRWYLRRDSWEEFVDHRAEQHYYVQGGVGKPHYPGTHVLRERYLADQHQTPEPAPRTPSKAPPGFQAVSFEDGRTVFVSELISVLEFARMCQATGRSDDVREARAIGPVNASAALDAPAVVTWLDACAYCAWLERQLGVPVRLLRLDEHQEIRPFVDPYTLQIDLQLVLEWEGFGEARQVRPLPWVSYRNLRFVDADDICEWVLHGEVSGVCGRYWSGPLAGDSWGEYKHLQVHFRVAVDGPSGIPC